MTKNHPIHRRAIIAAAVAALTPVTTAIAGTTTGADTVSTAGSTALKNWFVKSTTTFTDVTPGTQVTIDGVQYPSSLSEWAPQFGGTGTALAFQLAPKSYNNGVAVTSATNPGTLTDQASAVRFEYHESGSVEGILEMANDQIGPVNYVTQNVDRNPQTGIGNAVWVNYSAIGGSTTAIPFSAATGAQTNASNLQNSYYLGNFYSGTNTFTSAASMGGAQPQFNLSGGNLNGGQNAVQLAVSDAIPVQVFAQPSTGTDSNAATPWARTPADANYGTGNPALSAGLVGTANSRQVYQSTAALNMSATAINPRTGTAFGTGAWNSGGLNNLTTQTVAVTATLFVANPGTGLTQVDQTDAQWLETTGRLQNGAVFNMTTRDVNSGTRNVSALETGIDPTWATGKNDNGNGNAANGAGPANASAPAYASQISIGPDLRFSNKTAGGNELRPTVEVSRMAVGTLAITDNSSVATNGKADPLRTLLYSPSPTGAPLANGSSSYVLANYYTITGTPDATENPNNQQYQIFQNEQFVTLKTPDASYNTSSPNIQGDTNGDVKALINNSLSSVVAFNSSASNPASPAAGLETQGYILPQQMSVLKAENGLNTPGSVSAIVANTVANGASAAQAYNAASAASPTGNTASEITTLNMGTPSSITTGTGSFYGGSSAAATAPGFVSQIPITTVNYLFGNFNQNGVRDYDAVVVEAQAAQAALYASGAGVSALNGSSNQTHITTGIAALDGLVNPTADTNGNTVGVTKGDLIALGDYDGNGTFDGMDLYLLATGASLANTGAYQPTEVHTATGTVFTTGHLNTNASSFSTAINSGTLFKNTALDYLQSNGTAQQKIDGAAVLELPVGITALPVGSTLIGTDPVSGQVEYTFDPTGKNAFNKTDVNRDGVVDFNDVVLVDNSSGLDYTSLANSLTAVEQAPLTGTSIPANLVLISQTDTGTKIGANDLTVANTALTGVGATNWYGYALNKTGPGTITFNRTGGTVTVFSSAAALNISSGTVQIGAAMDPFTDSSVTSSTDTTKSISVVANSGTLEYLAGTSTINLQRIGSLNVSTGGVVKLDPAAVHTARTALEVGSLTLSGGKIDLGNGDLIVQAGGSTTVGAANLAMITSAVASGFNMAAGGNFNGATGIVSSSAAADTAHLTTLGVVENSQTGTGSGMYSSGNTFDGVAVNPTDVLVKFTYFGDANLDGKVDGSDYSLIDAGYASNGSLTGWYNGDFNYDGTIDGSDYALLDNAFNNQGNQLTTPTALTATSTAQVAGVSPTAVPEPTSLGLAAIAAASLGARRRRASR